MILRHRKIVLPNKGINKTRSTKNQENSAHRFGDNYFPNHLELNPEELEVEYALVIIFLKENR